MHFPFIIKENTPFKRKDLQEFFELRAYDKTSIFWEHFEPTDDEKSNFIANDSYDNANDVMKNGILLGSHQGLTEAQFVIIDMYVMNFLINFHKNFHSNNQIKLIIQFKNFITE